MKFRSYGPSGPNTASTSSPSFLRRSPWSTNTQVSCLPTALDNRTAATDESTPPDNAQSTFPFPIFSRRLLIVSSTKESIFQSPEHLHTSMTNARSIFIPSSVCITSGWNCVAYKFFSAFSIAANGQFGVVAVDTNPSGASAI